MLLCILKGHLQNFIQGLCDQRPLTMRDQLLCKAFHFSYKHFPVSVQSLSLWQLENLKCASLWTAPATPVVVRLCSSFSTVSQADFGTLSKATFFVILKDLSQESLQSAFRASNLESCLGGRVYRILILWTGGSFEWLFLSVATPSRNTIRLEY